MSSFISNIFSWISDLFESIWRFIKRALPYVLMAIAAYFSLGALAPSFMAGLGLASATAGGWAAAALALGASFVLAPEETAALYSGAIDAVGGVLSEAGQVVGDVVSDTVGSFFSSGIGLWLLVGVGAYFLLSSGKKKDVSVVNDGNSPAVLRTSAASRGPRLGSIEGQLNKESS